MSVTNPWHSKPKGVPCDYVNGKTAKLHEVYVDFRPDEMVVELTFADDEHAPLIWPVSHLRYVRGQEKIRAEDVPMGVYTSALSPAVRLYVRDRDLRALIEQSATALRKKVPATGQGRLAGLIAGAVLSVGLIVFGLIPLIANQLAMALPVEGERALGDKTYESIRTGLANGPVALQECHDPKGLAALREMQSKLIGASDLDPDAIRLTVLDFDMVNAFALPGGRVVVMRGLIDSADSPEEVAAVIAHEIGHIAHRDPTRSALRGVGTFGVLSLVFGDFAGGTVVLMGVNQLVNAQYSQEAETAADAYAHDLLPKVGVSPEALGTFFEKLKEEHGDTEGFVAHLSSHPQLVDRMSEAEKAALSVVDTTPILSESQWTSLRGICSKLAKERSWLNQLIEE